MTLTFKMTADEFYSGWKFKKKKGKLNNTAHTIIFIVAAIGFLVLGIITKDILLALFSTAFMIIAYSSIFIFEKKSITQEYNFSRILNDEHTIKLYDEGIEFFNSFEKIYTPWQSLFAVKETKDNLIILPTFRKGIFVINKSRYSGENLDKIISALQKNIKIEEGK